MPSRFFASVALAEFCTAKEGSQRLCVIRLKATIRDNDIVKTPEISRFILLILSIIRAYRPQRTP